MPARQQNNRRPRLAVNGLLLLNKPAGMTSNQALQKVKRILRAKKAGHTGALDPAATGMLPLCFGEATKVCSYMLDADKTYRVTARLGEATDTGDADGQIVDTADVPALSADNWQQILAGFQGQIEQVPPMYSALKKDGKRLYELARKGQTVEREPRKITVHAIELLEAHGQRLVFRVTCSKGTYVRTLVEDIATTAGTVAHTANLYRESVGRFREADMVDLGKVEAYPNELPAKLIPADQALSEWPGCNLEPGSEGRFRDGQAVDCDASVAGLVRVYSSAGVFLGIGESGGDKRVKPRRIFHSAGDK